MRKALLAAAVAYAARKDVAAAFALVDAACAFAGGVPVSGAEGRRVLFDVAEAYAAATEDIDAAFALMDAACAFVDGAGAPDRTQVNASADSSAVVPFGPEKGKLLAEATSSGLVWLAQALASNIANPRMAQWRAKNEALLAQVRAELARR